MQVVGRADQIYLRSDLAVRVDDTLGRTRRSGGEDDRAFHVRPRRRRLRSGTPAAGQLVQVVVDSEQNTHGGSQGTRGDACARQAHGSPGGEAWLRGNKVVDSCATQGATHAGEPEALVGHHDDGPCAPHGVDDRCQVCGWLDEEADPVTRTHPRIRQPGRQLGDPPRHGGPADPGALVGHDGTRILGAAIELRPQGLER